MTECEQGAIPSGWACGKLGAITGPSSEKIEPGDAGDANYLSLEHIEAQTNRIIARGNAFDVRSTKSVFRSGDVLYGKLRPYLNKVCVPDFDGVCSTDILVFPKRPEIEAKYLMWFLSQPAVVEHATHHSSGVQLPRVNFSVLAELDIPLPPTAEQRRIVEKVEELFARVDGARAHLAKVPPMLHRFRQSVLAAACSGSLTEDWRAFHTTKAVDRRASDPRSDDLENSDAFAPELPVTWAWVAIDDACAKVIDYRGRTPPVGEGGDIPYLRTTNIRNGRIDWDTKSFVTQNVYSEYMTRGIPQKGDVIFTMEAPLGDVAVIDTSRKFSLAQRLLLLRGHPSLLLGPYLALALTAPAVRRAIEVRATGSTVSGIAYKRFRFVRVPVPPLEEQVEIVERATKLIGVTVGIDRHLSATSVAASKLTGAILAKAFRGELVPTEAELAREEGRDYETAEDLLMRIGREVNGSADRGRPRHRPTRSPR